MGKIVGQTVRLPPSPYVMAWARGGVRGVGDIDLDKFLGCKGSGGFQKQTQPLPIGRYWIDIVGQDKITALAPALNTANQAGVIVIENTDLQTPSVMDKLTGGLTEPIYWVLFRVTGFGSISIDPAIYGYPTIAPNCVKQQSDTDTADEAKAQVDKEAAKNQNLMYAGLAFVAFLLLAHSANEIASTVKVVRGE